MVKPELKYQIFDLDYSQFERLCQDLLKAEFGFEETSIQWGLKNDGVDIIGVKGIEKTAIKVWHKYQLWKGSLQQEIEEYKHLLEYHHKFIYITSASIDTSDIIECESEKITIISQNELIKLLDKHSNIGDSYFKIVKEKKRSTKYWFTTSLIGLLVSVLASLFTFVIGRQENEKPLTSRIENVEEVLKGIKGLEKHLEGIKEDMIKTEIENRQILEEYEKLQGLKKIIDNKKESLQLILNYQPWYKKLLNYFLGVMTGIFTSIIGSILLNKWKLNRSLKN